MTKRGLKGGILGWGGHGQGQAGKGKDVGAYGEGGLATFYSLIHTFQPQFQTIFVAVVQKQKLFQKIIVMLRPTLMVT
jgi:hypothetical protein